MKLYHGSNVEVREPELRIGLRALDFGAGFYLTSSREQAARWARNVSYRRGAGVATVNVFYFDETEIANLKVLKFNGATSEWLDFVVANRMQRLHESQFDLVIGPVANDSTLPVIDDYVDGKYTKEEAVRRLLPQKLTDQYAFLSERALKMLRFSGSEVAG